MMKLYTTVHYCKADKKSGKPVIVTNAKGERRKTNKWKMNLFDKDGNAIRLEIVFNNSKGKAKAQGATTVLKVFK